MKKKANNECIIVEIEEDDLITLQSFRLGGLPRAILNQALRKALATIRIYTVNEIVEYHKQAKLLPKTFEAMINYGIIEQEEDNTIKNQIELDLPFE